MSAANIVIHWIGGNCPVQAEGTVNGKEFYFRARGSHWSFSVESDGLENEDWEYDESYGDGPYDAGWMTEDEARKFISFAAELYLEEAL